MFDTKAKRLCYGAAVFKEYGFEITSVNRGNLAWPKFIECLIDSDWVKYNDFTIKCAKNKNDLEF